MSGFDATVYPVPLSSEHKVFEGIDVGCTIEDMIPEDKHAIAFINKRVIPYYDYGSTSPVDGDHVVIQTVPTATAVAAVAAIGSAWAAAAGYALLSIAITVVGALAKRSMIDPPEPLSAGVPQRLPGISGQSNRMAPFEPIDTIYGDVRTIPKLGGKPIVETMGGTEYLRMLFVVGHGPLQFSEQDIKIGESPLVNFGQDNYEVNVYNSFTPDTDKLKIYNDVVDQDEVNILTDSEGDKFTRTTPVNTAEIVVNMTAPRGLTMIEGSDQSMERCDVGFYLYIRKVGDTEWQWPEIHEQSDNIISKTPQQYADNQIFVPTVVPAVPPGGYQIYTPAPLDTWDKYGSDDVIPTDYGFKYRWDDVIINGNFVMTGCTRDTIRASVRITEYQGKPLNEQNDPGFNGQYEIRLERAQTAEVNNDGAVFIYPRAYDAGEMADVVFTTVSSYLDDDIPVIQYPEPLGVIELRMQATNQLNGVIDSLSVRSQSLLTMPGQGRVPTSNPAWIYRDILAGYSGKTRVDPAKIDDATLQKYADFCDARGYEFNAVVNPADRFSVIQQVLAIGRGTFYIDDHLFSVIWETVQQNPKQLFTPRNSTNFQGQRTYQKLPHALRTQYINPENGWERDEVIVYRDGFDRTNATRFETLDVSYGITDREQAVLRAHEMLREIQLRPESFQRDIDIEYLVTRVGDRVAQTHEAILVGLGSARITEIHGSDITFDQTFEMAAGTSYYLQIRDSNADVFTITVATEPGLNWTVTATQPIPSTVGSGDLVAFGDAQDMIIQSVEVDDDRTATVHMIPYAPEIYNVNQPLPDYDYNINAPVDIHTLPPPKPDIEAVRSDESVMVKNSDGSLSAQIYVAVNYPAASNIRVDKTEVVVNYRGHYTRYAFERNERIVIPDVRGGELYVLSLRSISDFGVPSESVTVTETVVGKSTPPPDVQNFRSQMEKFNVRLRWNAVQAIDVAKYILEIQEGNVWKRLDVTDTLTWLVDVLPAQGVTSKTYSFRIKAQDSAGLVSENWTYTDVTINTPDAPDLEYQFDGANLVLSWNEPDSEFAISQYVVYRDGIVVDRPKTQLFIQQVYWGAAMQWAVAAVDVAGNVGAKSEITAYVTPPTVSMEPSQVIGNDVLLYWNGTPATLPIDHYEIYKGDNAPNRLQGTSDSTFTSLAETQSGTYTYWVIAVDTAGNPSEADSVTNEVSAPSGFELFGQFVETFEIPIPSFYADFESGTYYTANNTSIPDGRLRKDYTNVVQEDGFLVLPVDKTQTWGGHYTNNGWTTPQDQINAGYPIYAQPAASTATVQFVYDMRVVVPSSKIVVAPEYVVLDGSPSITFDIDIKENASDPWTTHNNVTQVYETSFRYIRITVHVSSNGTGLVRFNELGTRVSVETVSDRGIVQMTGNPTHVTFNKDFIDIQWITGTIIDGTPGTVVVDYQDVPTPQGFDAYAYDLQGNPITPRISWAAEGN